MVVPLSVKEAVLATTVGSIPTVSTISECRRVNSDPLALEASVKLTLEVQVLSLRPKL